LGVKFTIILGEDELNKEVAILRDMEKSQQEEVSLSKLVEVVKSRCLS